MKHTILAVLPLVLAACAAQPLVNRELHDGAPARAPAITYTPFGAHVPPAGTMPEYWAEPHAAPLLQTEPPFPARTSAPAPEPVVLGVRVPVPEENLERIPVNQCLARIHKVLGEDVPRRSVVSATSEEKRRCIVFSLLAACLLELKAQVEVAQNRAGMKFYPPAVEALVAVQGLSRRREGRACSGITGAGGTLSPEEHEAWVQLQRSIALGMDFAQ